MLCWHRAALLAILLSIAAAAPGLQPAAFAADDAIPAKEAYNTAKELGTVEAWEAFLESYPDGFLANMARAQIKKLKGESTTGESKDTAQPESEPEAAAAETVPPSQGALYVAPNGSDGDGDGSAEKPWATITNAVRNATDGATILVRPGLYMGRTQLQSDKPFEKGITIRSEIPYAAKLRAKDATVVTCYGGCQGITIEGFDIAHADPGTAKRVIVMHVDGQGDKQARRITIRNNILHDSYDNDILKINNNASDVTVEGNVFYNQGSSDEHVDINSVTDVVVQDNIFFNDYEGSGRKQPEEPSSYIVIKDSNGEDDGRVGCDRITVRRNIFANWQGSPGAGFVLVGEDGKPFHEARNVLIENNLMLGNGTQIMRAPFGTKGSRDVTFRNNTVAGDMPGRAFAMRLNVEGENPPNENIRFFNNIWSDPVGTMGATGEDTKIRFAEVPKGETKGVMLDNNLYWNGGGAIPQSDEDGVNTAVDKRQKAGDPGLGDQSGLAVPLWNEKAKRFGGGSATIREAFEKLVKTYGTPAAGSAAIDAARADQAPGEDILGRKRPAGAKPDVGAVELQ